MLPKPYYETDNGKLFLGDCIDIMREMEPDSVQCVVTSPPYWGLRDYGVDGQIGLESTPEEYISKMVTVFREVRRVLRPDGTLWLNMGDCYIGGGRGGLDGCGKGSMEEGRYQKGQRIGLPTGRIEGLKPKDLCMMPARLALALQADGWYLRSDIIWAKKNCMPESVTDRPTKSHEYVFLLTKNAKYYYDSEAIKEGARDWGLRDRTGQEAFTRGVMPNGQPHQGCTDINFAERGRNKRSVWTIATQPFPEAHFATFPEKLVIPCIKAGTSEKGNCSVCGKPWTRVVESSIEGVPRHEKGHYAQMDGKDGTCHYLSKTNIHGTKTNKTLGWQPSCSCNADIVKPIVLDPFGGSCTVAKVCEEYGRRWVMCELSQEYCDIGKNRIKREVAQPRFA